MAVVFVHGVADTHHVWDEVQKYLLRSDTVPLALPGFGTPVPSGFTATKEEYVDWVIAQLEDLGEPADLVGHDWGCIFTARVASLRPDLVRTWAGGSGPISAKYQWHQWAKIWQTPGAGEQWMKSLNIEEFGRILGGLGVPSSLVGETFDRIDATMKECILRLYRSAVHLGTEWEPGLAQVTAPALVFWGREDQPTPVTFADELGKALHAKRILKVQSNHYTILQQPEEIASALHEHWVAASM